MKTSPDEKILKDAQYRKGLSIAFFNATNAAISLVATSIDNGRYTDTQLIEKVVNYRNAFIDQYKEYYATVIANVGVNYRAENSIEKLKATKTLEDLQTVWRLFSEDERRDGEILKVAKELRLKYEKA